MLVQKQIDDFKMNLNISDGGISSVLYYEGGREKAFMSLLNETVKEGMTCLDLGGNIGYTTLPMLRNVGPEGFVYAVEPDSQSIGILTKNVEDNGYNDRCEVTQCAISGHDGIEIFWEASKPNLSSVKKNKYSTTKKEVPCFSLNTFLQDRRYPNFIKMDVEGHEVKIFEGGLDYFTKNEGHTNILLEVHPNTYDKDNDFEKILREYFKLGFNSKWVIATPVPQPALFKAAGYEPTRTIHTDGFHRGLYNNVSNDHLAKFACNEHFDSGSRKIVRSFMISR
jgi:FkbM family methyltransferase